MAERFTPPSSSACGGLASERSQVCDTYTTRALGPRLCTGTAAPPALPAPAPVRASQPLSASEIPQQRGSLAIRSSAAAGSTCMAGR